MKIFKKLIDSRSTNREKNDPLLSSIDNIYEAADSRVKINETEKESFNIWQAVESKLDIQSMKPKRKNQEAYEVTIEKKREDDTSYFIKSISNNVYLSLNEEEFFVWELLDGELTIKEICTKYFLKYKKLSNMPVKLIQLLESKNMMDNDWWDIYDVIYRLQRKGFKYTFKKMSRFFLNCKFSLTKTDKLFKFLYNKFGWIFLRKEAIIIYILLIIAGFSVFMGMGYFSQRYSLKSFITQKFSMIILLMFSVFPVFLHEFAHAFTCVKYGRKVNRAGIMLYIGLPMFFVETTDIWMRPKKERIYVSLAGPFTDLLVGSICFLLHKLFGNHGLLQLLPIVGLIAFFRCLYNFNPLLEFDGYYILMDILDIPELRKKAFNFISKGGVKKLVKSQKLTKEEYILLIYGVIAGVYTYWMIFFMIYMWQTKIRNIIMDIWKTSYSNSLSLALIIVGGLFVLIRLLFLLKLLYKKIEPFFNRLYTTIAAGVKSRKTNF